MNPDSFPRWWRHAPSLQRVVADLLAGELAQMRPGRPQPAGAWRPESDLRADLGADSLELIGLATSMEGMLHLRRGLDEPLLARTRLGDWLAVAAAGLEEGGDSVTFRTSGSSGTPKAIRHETALLWQEAVYLASLFPGRRRIVSLAPSHHIYAFLFSVLLPHALGIGPDMVVDLRAYSPAAVAQQLQPGDLVLGFPDFWRAFSEVGGAGEPAEPAGGLPPDVVGVTSTAPCPPEVARVALASGLERLVQVYGSSETAGVGWRDDPEAPYALFPFWSRTPDPATLARRAPDGRRLDYPLQDRLDWPEDGRFRPLGRIDHAVQVGGVNVFPAYVADVLRLHPQVQESSVRLMRADEGQRLKAFIVPRGGVPANTSLLRADLHRWMASRLSAAECPAAYSFGPGLPRQASGKLTDWIIDAWA
ncbi:AMP-binding protein [Massilia sp. ZL223]|uniref:AMP-binding protein n=1 Tax=Massilia sp. ZL223 TaxID=2824904 RepID=UPI001B831115|nr:AMP-binding protein [Massilia sp. ZL223]MBQ5963290.1 AMP-binding protein [Massilia sp. ZL223]